MSLTGALLTDIAHVGDLQRSSAGDLGTITGLANFKNALFHRLVTVPGTLVHRPTYGVGLPLFLNGPTSFATQQRLAAAVMEQFKQDPRVAGITSVSVTSLDGTPQTTVISVSVQPIGYTEIQMKFTPFGVGV